MKDQATRVLVICAVILILEFFVVSILSAKPGTGTDATVLLTVITAAAVAIERLLEGLWSTVALFGASDWWPLNALSQEVQAAATSLNTALAPFFTAALAEIDAVAAKARLNVTATGEIEKAAAAAAIDKAASDARATVDQLKAQLTQLGSTKLSSARLQAIVAAANQAVSGLQAQYPAIQASGALASTVIADFSSAVDYLKDNPGRKVISLFLGMVLGMVVAGLFSFDVVQAILGPSAANFAVGGHRLYVTVALTGMAIGLGSSPLHEVISTLQQIKTTQKIANS